jgi:hypothetical protein
MPSRRPPTRSQDVSAVGPQVTQQEGAVPGGRRHDATDGQQRLGPVLAIGQLEGGSVTRGADVGQRLARPHAVGIGHQVDRMAEELGQLRLGRSAREHQPCAYVTCRPSDTM